MNDFDFYKINEIAVENARFQSVRSGILQCDKCNGIICRTGSGIKSFKLVFVCKCSSMGKVECNTPKRKFKDGEVAIMRDNNLICPVCGKKLMSFNADACVNTAFRIKCSCGVVYDKYKESSELNKTLKEYKKLLRVFLSSFYMLIYC